MSAHELLVISRILAIAAILIMVVGSLVSVLMSQQRKQQMVLARLSYQEGGEVAVKATETFALGRFQKFFVQAGVEVTTPLLMGVITLLVVLSLVAYLFAGALFAVLISLALVAFIYLYLRYRFGQRRRIIYENTPLIVDSIIRNMDAGRSLEQALLFSLQDAPDIFKPLLFRIRSAIEAGREYTHLLDSFADIYETPPLVFVAVALRTSNRFGSSVRPVLRRVSDALRDQEDMRREFMAATAETRFTAAAFALFPPLIGVGLVSLNEEFRNTLLNTSAGHTMLTIAIGLIVVAIAIIVRMVQGVGRD